MDTGACALQSLGSQRVSYDEVCAHAYACVHTHTHTHGDTNRISGFQELKEGRGTNRQNTRDF